MSTDELMIDAAPEETGPSWLQAGVHNVTIADIQVTKDKEGNAKKNSKGDGGYDVKFVDSENKDHTTTFWMGEKSQWRFYNMLKAAGIDTKPGSGDKLKRSEIVGSRLWLALRNKYKVDQDGNYLKNDNGYKIFFQDAFAFVQFIDAENPPAFDGSAEPNEEGITSGNFYTEWMVAQVAQEMAPQDGSDINAAFGVQEEPVQETANTTQERNKDYPDDWDGNKAQ